MRMAPALGAHFEGGRLALALALAAAAVNDPMLSNGYVEVPLELRLKR